MRLGSLWDPVESESGSQEFAILAQKWPKIVVREKVDSWVFANQMPATALLPPTVHGEGVSRGRVRGCGSLRWIHVTCDRLHASRET